MASGSESKVVDMAGAVGYSCCDEDGVDCPFYVGSLDTSMVATSETITLECADGTTDTKTLGGLSIDLVQPAWGYKKSSYPNMKFSPGAFLLESSGTIDDDPIPRRSWAGRVRGVP